MSIGSVRLRGLMFGRAMMIGGQVYLLTDYGNGRLGTIRSKE